MKWNKERLKNAAIGDRIAKYKAIPANAAEALYEKSHPEIFNFEAISIGDDGGQAFLIPLDESDNETAEYILRAIKAYQGD